MTNQPTTADLPAWEALYEPGNVSTYLIGYANDQDAATGMAEAWLRSQAEVTGRLEWVDDKQMATGRYDRWFELIERHDGGVDTGPGIIVRRRVADDPEPAAVSAAVAPPTNRAELRDRIAEAMRTAPSDDVRPDWTAPGGPLKITARINDLADAVLAVLPEPTDRAAVLREAADRIDNEELPHDYVDMFDNGARWAADRLRRMADETATETPTVTVHAAPDLSPTAEEALDALIDVAKQQAVCDFEHPHPEHPCGRRTAAGARQDGAET